MVRTNGNRNRIGNVYRATGETLGATVSAFQFALEAHTVEDADYLYHFLTTSSVQSAISAAASGTTGLGNVAARYLKSVQIPWPAPSYRAEVCALGGEVCRLQGAALVYGERLRMLRSAVLDELLSGTHTIPSSYDWIIGDAA